MIWESLVNDDMGISFKYPDSWTCQEFSCNLDGVAICLSENEGTDCGQTCGMDSPSSPIYFYIDTWNNSKDKQKSFYLSDSNYKDIFDKILSTFRFIEQ